MLSYIFLVLIHEALCLKVSHRLSSYRRSRSLDRSLVEKGDGNPNAAEDNIFTNAAWRAVPVQKGIEILKDMTNEAMVGTSSTGQTWSP